MSIVQVYFDKSLLTKAELYKLQNLPETISSNVLKFEREHVSIEMVSDIREAMWHEGVYLFIDNVVQSNTQENTLRIIHRSQCFPKETCLKYHRTLSGLLLLDITFWCHYFSGINTIMKNIEYETRFVDKASFFLWFTVDFLRAHWRYFLCTLTDTLYQTIYDLVGDMVHWEVYKTLDFDHTIKWY